MAILEPLLEEEIEPEQKLPVPPILDWNEFYQMPFLANQWLEELDYQLV